MQSPLRGKVAGSRVLGSPGTSPRQLTKQFGNAPGSPGASPRQITKQFGNAPQSPGASPRQTTKQLGNANIGPATTKELPLLVSPTAKRSRQLGVGNAKALRKSAGGTRQLGSPYGNGNKALQLGQSRQLPGSPKNGSSSFVRSAMKDETMTDTVYTYSNAHTGMSVPTGPPQSKLHCVESKWFQAIIGFAIACNALVIGFESEIDFYGWRFLEVTFLTFFITELWLRCCLYGWDFFDDGGNLMDFMLVVAGALDVIFIPFFIWLSGEKERHEGVVYWIKETLRLARITRLVRLVKIVEPLMRLALGIAEAVQGMFWVLVFLMMMLYAAAILCTRLLGHGEAPGLDLDEEDPRATEVREMFNSVLSSMFVLFEMMSCWSLLHFVPLFNQVPLMKLLAVSFYVLMAWGLLAVMTGVVSEKIIAVKDAMANEEQDREHAKRQIAAVKLRDLFINVDVYGSGSIAREEFNSMLYCNELSKVMTECTQTNTEELTEVFNWLDHDGNGLVDIDEFIAGFTRLNEQVTPKSFLKFQEDASRSIRRLEKQLVALVHHRFDALVASVEAPLRKLSVVQEQVTRLEASLQHAEFDVSLLPEDPLTPDSTGGGMQQIVTDEEVEALEDRLMERVDQLLAVVESLED